MKIHKEGYRVILTNTIAFTFVSLVAYVYLPLWASIPVGVIAVLMVAFNFRFFRVPKRVFNAEDNSVVYSPADGKVVAIEEVYEDEFLNEKRIQVSVFMSIWNVHINWFPVGGNVEYFCHHNGKFRVAWHPKSSTENERTTTVVNTGDERILFRQIAGYVARRIVNYAAKGENSRFAQSQECGFIKFGSRVDILIPTDAEINVKLNEKVVGTQTVIATMAKTKVE